MIAPKIPAWLTAPEQVKGEPISRVPDWTTIKSKSLLREAILAFDARTRELEESIQTSARLASERACEMLRAEKAEAECERLRKRFQDACPHISVSQTLSGRYCLTCEKEFL